MAAPGQRKQAGSLVGTDDGIGHENIVDSAVSHRLCLAELGHGDAAAAGSNLQPGQLAAAVRFDMGPVRKATGLRL